VNLTINSLILTQMPSQMIWQEKQKYYRKIN